MTKDDVIKIIDGKLYYYSDYTNYLYKELEKKDLILKALEKHFDEHENYEDNKFLKQLKSCTENDIDWLKKMAGADK